MRRAEELGFNFVCYSGSGVTNKMIVQAVRTAKENFSGMIIAGKMHGDGVDEPIADEESVKAMIDAGADVILVPAVGTVPGFTSDELIKIVKIVHQHDGLVMSTIGTSQESSGKDVIREIALKNKMSISNISGTPHGALLSPTETIFELSKTIRGLNHTISRMARSINR